MVSLAEANVSKWLSSQKKPKPPRGPAPRWHWSFDLPHACGSCVRGEECKGTLHRMEGKKEKEILFS